MKVFRVLGTTNDVTECEYCGRVDLKGTVVLDILDADGNSEGVTHYGTGCAATAGKRTVKDIRDSAKAADAAALAARTAKLDEESRLFTEARDQWLTVNYGARALDNCRKHGFSSPYAMVLAFEKATGRV